LIPLGRGTTNTNSTGEESSSSGNSKENKNKEEKQLLDFSIASYQEYVDAPENECPGLSVPILRIRPSIKF
jgi:hypothetical protein